MDISNSNSRQHLKNNTWAHQNNIAHGSKRSFTSSLSGINIKQSMPESNCINENKSNYNYKRPLKDSALAQTTFKGLFPASPKELTPELKEECLKIMQEHSNLVYDRFKATIREFRNELHKNDKFCNDVDKEIIKRIKEGTGYDLPAVPKKKFRVLCESIIAPITKPLKILYKIIFLRDKAKRANFERPDKLRNQYNDLQGAFESFSYWFEDIIKKELDKLSPEELEKFNKLDKEGQEKYKAELIDKNKEFLKEKLGIRVGKKADPTKGNVNASLLTTGNRIVTGGLAAIFLATDAYNTTRMLTDDPKISRREAKARFLQETARISLTAYLTFITMNLFQKYTNKSAKAALLIGGINVIVAEIIGRKLIGRPVLRISKNQIDDYNKNTPASGPLGFTSQSKITSFKQNNNILSNSQISFKGNKTELLNTLTKKEFLERMDILKRLDKSLHGQFDELIKSKKALNEISENDNIEFGKKESMLKKFLDGLLGPLHVVKKLYKNTHKMFISIGAKLKNEYCVEELKKGTEKESDNKIECDKLKNLNTVYNVLEIISKAKNKGKNDEEIKSIITPKLISGVSFNDTNYDASTFSIHNRILCTALTSYFLVNDAYNLTMAHSKGDKPTAKASAKNRTLQEASRLTFAVYLMNLIHNPLSSIYNGSYQGAFGISALNVIMTEVIARGAVGVPFLPKTRKQLIENEKKNQESANPVKKLMQRVTGKKSISEQAKAKMNNFA